jgi:hypothetical protein
VQYLVNPIMRPVDCIHYIGKSRADSVRLFFNARQSLTDADIATNSSGDCAEDCL